MKGEVLGTVDHFYWKKEYQARGAPHYHALLWLKDAPVIGQDDPDTVLSWIQESISYLPNSKQGIWSWIVQLGHKISCNCPSVVHTVSGNASVVMFSLPGADLDFHGNLVKLLSWILLVTVSRLETEYTN